MNFPATGLYPGPIANLLYGGALADKVAGFEIDPFEDDGVTPRAEIRARFNSNLNGNTACLGGRKFYLGLDTNHGNDIDLVTVLLHEFAHGLGFQQFADVTTGARIADLDDVFNVHIFDNTTHKFWPQMTNAERAASAINPRNVVFDGPAVNAAVPGVLAPGTPLLTLLSPAALVGNYQVGPAQFGPPLASPGVTGAIVSALDASDAAGPSPTDACTAITNAAQVAGRIALVDRGTCGFAVKVKNAQNAGAIGVVVANNVAGGPPGGMAGVDPTITIPSVLITQADANAIKAQLANSASVSGTLGVNLGILAGADAQNVPLLYTPGSCNAGLDDLALGYYCVPESADGTGNQCRPDPLGHAAAGLDAAGAARHRMVPRHRSGWARKQPRRVPGIDPDRDRGDGRYRQRRRKFVVHVGLYDFRSHRADRGQRDQRQRLRPRASRIWPTIYRRPASSARRIGSSFTRSRRTRRTSCSLTRRGSSEGAALS